MAEDKMFIERFDGPNGQAEVHELASRDALGIEKIVYVVTFKEQQHEVPSMGEASVMASELAGDARFTSGQQNAGR